MERFLERHDDRIIEADVLGAVRRHAPASCDNAAAIDRDPAVTDRRPADRQNPGGVIANQWGPEDPGDSGDAADTTRSCLPDRLRAS